MILCNVYCAIKTRYPDCPWMLTELKVFGSCLMNYATLFLSSFDQLVVLVPDPSPPWVPIIMIASQIHMSMSKN